MEQQLEVETEDLIVALQTICDDIIGRAVDKFKSSVDTPPEERKTVSIYIPKGRLKHSRYVFNFLCDEVEEVPQEWMNTQEKRQNLLKQITQKLEMDINPGLWDKETRESIPGGSKKALVLQSIQQAILHKTHPKTEGADEMIDAWVAIGYVLLSLSRGKKALDFKDPLSSWILPIIGVTSQSIVQLLDACAILIRNGEEQQEVTVDTKIGLTDYFNLNRIQGVDLWRPPGRVGFFTDYAPQDGLVKYKCPAEVMFFKLLRRIIGKNASDVLASLQTIVDVWLDILLFSEVEEVEERGYNIHTDSCYGDMYDTMQNSIAKIKDEKTRGAVEFIVEMLFLESGTAVKAIKNSMENFVMMHNWIQSGRDTPGIVFSDHGFNRVTEVYYFLLKHIIKN